MSRKKRLVLLCSNKKEVIYWDAGVTYLDNHNLLKMLDFKWVS